MNTSQDPDGDKARGRFMVLQVLRLSGAAMVAAGLLIVNGMLAAVPHVVGYVLIVVGVVDAFVMPTVLARSWRSPGG